MSVAHRRLIPTQLTASWMNNARRLFRTSRMRLSADVFHVQDEADFQTQVIDSKKPFLVNFHARWCGPCRLLEPRLEKLIASYNQSLQGSPGDRHITLAKVDIDRFEGLSSKYKIQQVPTVLAIKNGKEIGRFIGLTDEDRIETMLDRLNR